VTDWRLFAADALVLAGIAGLTLAIAGVLRLPGAFARIHAASNGAVAGVAFVLAAALPGGVAMAARALLVGVLLLATTAVGTHALARLAHQERIRSRGVSSRSALRESRRHPRRRGPA
jgi:multicomponent Na+:H+ antiporter subunit G